LEKSIAKTTLRFQGANYSEQHDDDDNWKVLFSYSLWIIAIFGRLIKVH